MNIDSADLLELTHNQDVQQDKKRTGTQVSTNRQVISTSGICKSAPEEVPHPQVAKESVAFSSLSVYPGSTTTENLTRSPVASRASTLTTFVHYYRGTTKRQFSQVVALISAEVSHEPQHSFWGRNGYSQMARWAHGLTAECNPRRPDMGVCVAADGGACEHYGTEMILRLHIALSLRASRLDLAVDGCPFTASRLCDLWLENKIVTQARRSREPVPGYEGCRSCAWYTSPEGATFYMGSRPSSQFARCYDRHGSVRFEMELKGRRADRVAEVLCAGVPLAPVVGKVISEFVTFVDDSDSNRSRCKPLPFWHEFMSELGHADVPVRPRPRSGLTAERLVTYVETKLASLFAVYLSIKRRNGDLDEVVQALICRGLERAKPEYRALLDALEAGGQ